MSSYIADDVEADEDSGEGRLWHIGKSRGDFNFDYNDSCIWIS